MFNVETANIKELFLELQHAKNVLSDSLIQTGKEYENTKTKVANSEDATRYLKYYYEDDSLSKTITDSKDIIKIIENLLSDRVIHKLYVEQLEVVAGKERREGIIKFKQDWLTNIKSGNKQDYSTLYVISRDMDDWISDCKYIALKIREFIGEKNPLLDEQALLSNAPVNTLEITTETSSVEEKSGIGYFNIDRRKIQIGPAKNVPYKLLEALCPIGTQKSVDTVFTKSSTRKNLKAISASEQFTALKNRLKDLQKIFNKEKKVKTKDKIKISLNREKETGTIYLIRK